jgi:acyl carrier protein
MQLKQNLKQYILDEYFPENSNEQISDDINLIENGILDSLAVLKLVAYIEDQYNITLEPDEIDPDNLNSINAISSIINKKNGVD